MLNAMRAVESTKDQLKQKLNQDPTWVWFNVVEQIPIKAKDTFYLYQCCFNLLHPKRQCAQVGVYQAVSEYKAVSFNGIRISRLR